MDICGLLDIGLTHRKVITGHRVLGRCLPIMEHSGRRDIGASIADAMDSTKDIGVTTSDSTVVFRMALATPAADTKVATGETIRSITTAL